jgi:serine/threonine-protein kinase
VAALASRGTPEAVDLRLSMGGVSIGSARSQVLPEPDGSFRSLVDLASRRYLAGGRLKGHLSLLAGDSPIAARSFPVKAARSALLTLPGAVSLAAILFAAAYAESLLRTLRKGRRQRLGQAGLVALGVLMGPALAIFASFAAGREPSVIIALLAAALGAAAGLAATKAATEIGRFRRLARTNRPR